MLPVLITCPFGQITSSASRGRQSYRANPPNPATGGCLRVAIRCESFLLGKRSVRHGKRVFNQRLDLPQVHRQRDGVRFLRDVVDESLGSFRRASHIAVFPFDSKYRMWPGAKDHPAWSSDGAPVRAARSLPAPDRPPAAPLSAAAKIPPPASRFSAGSPSAPPASASRTIGARRDSGLANSTKPCAPAVTDERR